MLINYQPISGKIQVLPAAFIYTSASLRIGNDGFGFVFVFATSKN